MDSGRRWFRHIAVVAVIATVITAGLYVASRWDEAPDTASRTAAPNNTAEPVNATPYLPFDMPAMPSAHKVFAHYVPWFPMSPDNLPADRDYYALQYIRPTGENGAHAAYGGYIRDRPLARPPRSEADWRLADMRAEVDQAKSIGIDGFAVDIIDLRANRDEVDDLLEAASDTRDFSIQIVPDMSGKYGDASETEFADQFSEVLKNPAAQRLDDGRVVLAPFFAERKPQQWWAAVIAIMRNIYHVEIAFVPTFLDANANDTLESFAPISYGFGNWGTRNPAIVDPSDTSHGSPVDLIRRAHALGKIWMQPVAYQDNRPRSGVYEESQNGVTNRNSWQIAIDEHADWVQLVTWNDYAETTAIAPSDKHGWRMLDRTAFHLARFKFGFSPTVTRDALYVSYRTQPFAARPVYPQTVLMNNTGKTPPRDTVEVETYARAPSEVIAMIGDQEHRCAAPAGFGVCTFPLGLGSVRVGLYRDNANQRFVESPMSVTNSPQVQDLQYVVVGGLR